MEGGGSKDNQSTPTAAKERGDVTPHVLFHGHPSDAAGDQNVRSANKRESSRAIEPKDSSPPQTMLEPQEGGAHASEDQRNEGESVTKRAGGKLKGRREKAAGRRRPTHFIGIHVDSPDILGRVDAFQRAILQRSPFLKPCMTKQAKLHISILMLALEEPDVPVAIEAIEEAIRTFRDLQQSLQLDFDLIGTFGSRVLFGTMGQTQQHASLAKLHELLVAHIQAAGLRIISEQNGGDRDEAFETKRTERKEKASTSRRQERRQRQHERRVTAMSVDVHVNEDEVTTHADGPPVGIQKAIVHEEILAVTEETYEATEPFREAESASPSKTAPCMESARGAAAEEEEGGSEAVASSTHEPWEGDRSVTQPIAGEPAFEGEDERNIHPTQRERRGRRRRGRATKTWVSERTEEQLDERHRLERLYDKSEVALGTVTFYPHMTIMKTSQGIRRVKDRQKRKQLRIDVEVFHPEAQQLATLGTCMVSHVDLVEMTAEDPDGYYRRLATYSFIDPELLRRYAIGTQPTT